MTRAPSSNQDFDCPIRDSEIVQSFRIRRGEGWNAKGVAPGNICPKAELLTNQTKKQCGLALSLVPSVIVAPELIGVLVVELSLKSKLPHCTRYLSGGLSLYSKIEMIPYSTDLQPSDLTSRENLRDWKPFNPLGLPNNVVFTDNWSNHWYFKFILSCNHSHLTLRYGSQWPHVAIGHMTRD